MKGENKGGARIYIENNSSLKSASSVRLAFFDEDEQKNANFIIFRRDQKNTQWIRRSLSEEYILYKKNYDAECPLQ